MRAQNKEEIDLDDIDDGSFNVAQSTTGAAVAASNALVNKNKEEIDLDV